MAKRHRPSPRPAGPALVGAVIALAGCPERKRTPDNQIVPPQTAPPEPPDAFEALPPQAASQDDVFPPAVPDDAPQEPRQRRPPNKRRPQVPPPQVPTRDRDRPPQPRPPQPPQPEAGFEFPRSPPVLVGPFDRGE